MGRRRRYRRRTMTVTPLRPACRLASARRRDRRRGRRAAPGGQGQRLRVRARRRCTRSRPRSATGSASGRCTSSTTSPRVSRRSCSPRRCARRPMRRRSSPSARQPTSTRSTAGAGGWWSSCARRCAATASVPTSCPTSSTGPRRPASTVDGAALHLPLAGTGTPPRSRRGWRDCRPGSTLSVSHLTPECFATLQRRHPDRRLSLRVGTALWHGDKSFLHLGADVLDIRQPDAATAGYHASPRATRHRSASSSSAPARPTAIAPLADGRSPFHFDRHRLALLEPPHMHTSMCVAAGGQPTPRDRRRRRRPAPADHHDVDELTWT